MDLKALDINKLGLPVRTLHVFQKAGKRTLGDILNYTEEDLYKIRGLGKGSIDETLRIINEYKHAIEEERIDIQTTMAQKNQDVEISEEEKQQLLKDYLDTEGLWLEELIDLPTKEYNLLRLAGIKKLSDVLFLSEDELLRLPRISTASAASILNVCKAYNKSNADLWNKITADSFTDNGNNIISELTLQDMMNDAEARMKILEYFRIHDLPLTAIGVSNRLKNKLNKLKCSRLSQVMEITERDLYGLRGTGKTTVDEFVAFYSKTLEENKEILIPYINGDSSAVVASDDTLKKSIIDAFDAEHFEGLHFPEIMEKADFPVEVTEDKGKQLIGQLIADNLLEYVDYRCYLVYPSFKEERFLGTLEEKHRMVIENRILGLTLESIASQLGITRERVRQVEKKALKCLKDCCEAMSGFKIFDEDYYSYFYKTYEWTQEAGEEWFGVTNETYYYLKSVNDKQGKIDLEEALSDELLDVGLRLKIASYLNRNKIYVNGEYIKKRRSDIENYVLKHYCQNEIDLMQFIEIFNGFLRRYKVEDESLYLVDSNIQTRINKFMGKECRNVLYKHGRCFRYYDIDSRDYTELLDELNLDAYQNISIFTNKLFNEHFDLMKKYDLRDQYELHNLLKKIISEETYPELRFGRNPNLLFGTPDVRGDLERLVFELAPISTGEYADIVEELYGYPASHTFQTDVFGDLNKYVNQGEIRVDFEDMPEDHRRLLEKHIGNDPMTFEEIRKLYVELIPEADPNLITSYNLKQMGVNVFVGYVLRGNSDDYFNSVICSSDYLDYAAMKVRYGEIFKAFYVVFYPKVQNGELYEMMPDQYISMEKLEKSGISKEMLYTFRDEVNTFVNINEYFSIKHLKDLGFESELFDYGFDDLFYASILKIDERFSWNHMYGPIILYKGKEDISKRSFMESIIQENESIDLIDLMDVLKNTYGCKNADRSNIIGTLAESEVYYDKHLDRFYKNYTTFYNELD